ncbi:XrtN system VIT domain-containing protein [Arcticibacter tournemirensis]|uniref:XrtN system VIT domain-containing protein n=1 Tax=Arcticibacter tournemirensis TaxID=699437 RepID=A0A4Q0M3E2_9SPHI|nr:XrtN system VIT domain-containing protein [Arcticibacter tournemirensis]RXF67440.1 XrtN system VIT domain-containing protein [Arcticibacter tournemirensis]
MKTLREALLKDNITSLGIWLTFISAIVFLLCGTLENRNEGGDFSVFFLNYAITIVYSLVVLITAFKRYKWGLSKSKIDYTIFMLILWLISAFALNRVMNVFDDSVTWLSILLVLSCTSLALTPFLEYLLPAFEHFICFFVSISIMLFGYFALSLIPLYIISAPAALGLGISLHSYVPLLLTIFTIILALKSVKRHKGLIFSLAGGLLFCLVAIAYFNYSWYSINSKITKFANRNTLAEGKLPNWVVISQNIPAGKVSERILKSDLVYKTFNTDGNWLWGNFMNRRFDEKQQHDPLVVLATLFQGKISLDETERIKILESMYDSRHQAQERLWSGDELETRNIITNVRIFPEYRMAYTEKILNIRNKDSRKWGGNQEAIYTFHLPEGSVVSSLSLWIAGKEEKAYLTTKSKADSAYKQIVGVEHEQRDPSVIHWQEGNKVSVRVFPCTPTEDRKFKLGITSPLRKTGSQLVYENIYFDGPTANDATETLQLNFSMIPGHLNLPDGCEEMSKGVYQANRDYEPDWQLRFIAPKLSPETFSFDGKSYQIYEAVITESTFRPAAIYLDLNKQWTKDEFDALWEAIKTKTVYVFNDKLVQLREDNKDIEFEQLSKLNFSLFPIYKITRPAQSLLISKGTPASPNLSDLKGSEFANRLSSYLETPKEVALYNIGDELSPYIKTLKELRVFKYQTGDLKNLLNALSASKYQSFREDSATVVIDASGVSIRQSRNEKAGKAPDHLLRLFAYNRIMKKVAERYFRDDFIQPEIIAEAEKANIVSPVSSLIVLETQKDYERFGIEESKNSLKNASMKSSGAVPEPHEWVLILLTSLIVLYFIKRPSLKKLTA